MLFNFSTNNAREEADVNMAISIEEFANRSGMDLAKAIMCCADSKELCIDCLKEFADGTRQDKLETLYNEKNWKNYTVEVHSMKSSSRMLGFDELGDLAEKLQYAAEKEDYDYIMGNHSYFMGKMRELVDNVKDLS